MKSFTLLAKHDCHLCSAAKQQLMEMQQSHSFSFETIFVAPDDPLHERYQFLYPVLLEDGEVLCTGRIDESTLLSVLTAKIH